MRALLVVTRRRHRSGTLNDTAPRRIVSVGSTMPIRNGAPGSGPPRNLAVSPAAFTSAPQISLQPRAFKGSLGRPTLSGRRWGGNAAGHGPRIEPPLRRRFRDRARRCERPSPILGTRREGWPRRSREIALSSLYVLKTSSASCNVATASRSRSLEDVRGCALRRHRGRGDDNTDRTFLS